MPSSKCKRQGSSSGFSSLNCKHSLSVPVHPPFPPQADSRTRQIASKSSVQIDTIEQKVNGMLKEMEGLKSVISRPSFNQSLTDLGVLAEAELRRSRLPSTSGPNYVDKSTQTEPSAPMSGSSNENPPPPLSQFPPEIDLDNLPEPSGFPLWVNGVPTAADGSSSNTTPGSALMILPLVRRMV
jgi:hypothetical protein